MLRLRNSCPELEILHFVAFEMIINDLDDHAAARAHCMLLSRFADCCRTSFAPSTPSIGTAMKWSPTRQLRVIEPATAVGLVR